MDRQTVNTVILAASMAAGSVPVQPEPTYGPGVPYRMELQVTNAFNNLRAKGTLPPHRGLRYNTIRAAQAAIVDYFSHDTGYAWPSLFTAAEKAGLSLSTFRRARKWLIDAGFILAFPQWRREDRTPPGASRPTISSRSTHYVPQVLPAPMLSALSDDEYAALISIDGLTAEERRARRGWASGPSRVPPSNDAEAATVADAHKVPTAEHPAAHGKRFAPNGLRTDSGLGMAADPATSTAFSPTAGGNGAPRELPPPARAPSRLPTPALSKVPSPVRAVTAEATAKAATPQATAEEEQEASSLLERLEQKTGIRLMPDRVLALGFHYKLATSTTLQVAEDVLDWATAKHVLNPTRAWAEDELTDQFRIFSRAAARGRKPSIPAPSVTDSERAQLHRDAKLREQQYEKHKEAVQAREVDLGKLLFAPGFLAAKAFGVSAFSSLPLKRASTSAVAPPFQETHAQNTAHTTRKIGAPGSRDKRPPP